MPTRVLGGGGGSIGRVPHPRPRGAAGPVVKGLNALPAARRASMRAACVAAAAALVALSGATAAQAHTTVGVGPYEIEVGWGTEPPIEGMRNTVVYSITESAGSEGVRRGVAGSFAGLDATLVFGGAEREAEVLNDARPGHYYTKIIPTRPGSYSVHVAGEISGTAVDVEVPIEDVERTAALDFPPRAASGGDDVAALRAAVSAMQRGMATGGAAPAADPAAYDIAVFGAAFGVAGIALASIALLKRR